MGHGEGEAGGDGRGGVGEGGGGSCEGGGGARGVAEARGRGGGGEGEGGHEWGGWAEGRGRGKCGEGEGRGNWEKARLVEGNRRKTKVGGGEGEGGGWADLSHARGGSGRGQMRLWRVRGWISRAGEASSLSSPSSAVWAGREKRRRMRAVRTFVCAADDEGGGAELRGCADTGVRLVGEGEGVVCGCVQLQLCHGSGH